MRYNSVIEKLQNLTNNKITQQEIADIIGVGQNAISGRAKRNSEFSEAEIISLQNHYNVIFDDDNITLDYFPEVCGSCGNGVFQFSTHREQIVFPKSAIFKNFTPGKQYFVINAYGNSMEPFICDKDKLVIENWDGEQIIDNRPYVFCYHDEIFIKRLAKNVNQLVIIPENKDYDVIKLTGPELKEVDILGQIVGLMRDLR